MNLPLCKPRLSRAEAWLFLMAGLIVGRTGTAYETLGMSWPGNTAAFRINPSFPDFSLSGTPEEQTRLILCAAGAWRDQSRAAFEFDYRGLTGVQVLNDRDGINAVFWADQDGGDALAATLISGDRGVIRSFDIVLYASTNDVPNRWSGPGEPASGEYDIQGVVVHELGHALGLDHSNVSGATMFPSAVGRALPMRTLATDDREGVESIYGLRGTTGPTVEIASVNPEAGPEGGGNEVVLEGLNFTYASDTSLHIGGVLLLRTEWTVESCGLLRISRMPAHSPGVVDLRMTNTIGSVLMEGAYSYEPDPSTLFVRGDVNEDGEVNLSDPVFILDFLFRGQEAPGCIDAADGNDDSQIDISDAVTLLLFMFQEGKALPLPYPTPGTDPTADDLGCRD